MNAVCEDIKNILEAESSLGLVFNTNLFLYREPAKPDNTVTIFEGPGMPPLSHLGSNEDTKHIERPSIQIRIRYKNADEGFELAYEIQNVLHALIHEVQGSYNYQLITAISSPALIDWDDSNRARIALNFNIQRRLT